MMLKLLIKKQLAEIFAPKKRGRKQAKVRSMAATIAIWVVLVLLLGGMFSFYSWLFCEPLCTAGLDWMYFLVQGGIALVFGVFGSVFSTYSSLYLAKDNDLLLSMPIPERSIILSRLMGVYLVGLLYSAMASVPAVVVYWITTGFRFATVVGGLLLVLLISGLVLALSCLLGWVVAQIAQRLKNRSFITVLLSLGFLALYYVVYFKFMNQIQNLVQNVMILGPKVRDSAYPLYLFGRIGTGDWLAMLWYSLGVGALLALIWILLKKTFMKLAIATPGGKKAVYRAKETRQSSADLALLRKEWSRFKGSAAYMLNCGLGLVMQLALGVYLLLQGKKILAPIGMLLAGFEGCLPVLMCAVICLVSGTVDISAPSVSLEGKYLWQLRVLPVSPWQALRAKLNLHLGIAALPLLLCAVVGALVVPGTLAQKLLVIAVSLLFGIFTALFGLVVGVLLPNLNWTNEMLVIKQSAAVFFAIFAPMILSIAMGGLYLWFGWKLGATGWLSAVGLLFVALDGILFLWLKGKGAARFQRI